MIPMRDAGWCQCRVVMVYLAWTAIPTLLYARLLQRSRTRVIARACNSNTHKGGRETTFTTLFNQNAQRGCFRVDHQCARCVMCSYSSCIPPSHLRFTHWQEQRLFNLFYNKQTHTHARTHAYSHVPLWPRGFLVVGSINASGITGSRCVCSWGDTFVWFFDY